MKTFIKGINIFLLVFEILTGIGLGIGLLFRHLALAGAKELCMLTLSSLAIIYFLKAVTPFYKKYVSDSPVMSETFPLIMRRLLFVAMVLYVFALLFLANDLAGQAEMMRIGFSAAIGTGIISGILWVTKRERLEVFIEPGLRMVCLFILHWLLSMGTVVDNIVDDVLQDRADALNGEVMTDGAVQYKNGMQILSVNNVDKQGAYLDTVRVLSNAADSMDIMTNQKVKVFLSNPSLSIVQAYAFCEVTDESIIDTASYQIRGCNVIFPVDRNTVTVTFGIPEPVGPKQYGKITIISKDQYNVFRYHRGIIKYFARKPKMDKGFRE